MIFKNILVTGAAGFIGYHLCIKLIKEGFKIVGYDNLNDYYDLSLKKKRLQIITEISKGKDSNWNFVKGDLENKKLLDDTFKNFKPQIVINLAAQAGVRYSIENPSLYISSNIVGFSNLLECCKIYEIKNLLYASSSSVYGGNTKTPFSETDSVNHQVSVYAATKKSNELLAHTYSHLYKIPTIGMRFFTVYGPWGRPDMSPMLFAKSILSKEPIKIFNYGEMSRSFTYIDDTVEIILKLIHKPAVKDNCFNTENPNPATSWAPHRIFNLGNDKSVKLMDFISKLEKELQIDAIKEFQSIQPGDVKDTLSDCNLLENWIGNFKYTPIEIGIRNFVSWYKKYYDY